MSQDHLKEQTASFPDAVLESHLQHGAKCALKCWALAESPKRFRWFDPRCAACAAGRGP